MSGPRTPPIVRGTNQGTPPSPDTNAGQNYQTDPPGPVHNGDPPGARNDEQRPRRRLPFFLVGYFVVAIAGLIVLRTLVGSLDFISIGWMIVLVVLPLLPWLLPSLGEYLKSISPYVKTLKLAGVEIGLRQVRSAPIAVPTGGVLASVPNDAVALSSGTTISLIISSLRNLRLQGGSQAGIIDLQNGHKWRLPNLYFLARLLEIDPVVSQLIFTEMRGGTDGYLVGTCEQGDLRRRIEQAVPIYARAAGALLLPAGSDLTNLDRAQELGSAFQTFMSALGISSSGDDDPIHGYVNTRRISQLRVPLSHAAINAPGETLDEGALSMVLDAPNRFIPTTVDGRLADLIDRDAVALAVARTLLTRKP